MPIFDTMSLSSQLLEKAVDQLATLPGIGRRTATRLALDLLRREPDQVRRFTESIQNLSDNVQYCNECCNISDSAICDICSDPTRDRSLICVVQDIRDVVAIEGSKQYKGLYHVLGGVISPLEGISPEDLNTRELLERAEQEGTKEVVLAMDGSVEGDTTCYYLFKHLQTRGVMVSVIARGLSVGGELEHADEITLGRSIMDRIPYEKNLSRT
jgi:recombination protein RecR